MAELTAPTLSVAELKQIKERIHRSWSDPQTVEGLRRLRKQIAHFFAPVNPVIIAAAQIKPGMRVLDLASGTGEPALRIAELLGSDGHITATDLSAEMLNIAASAAEEHGLTNISFQQADAEELPFPDAAFDAVTCRFGIMFCPDPAAALREARRVLRPGGRAAFTAWGPPLEQTWFSATAGILAKYAEFPTPPRGAPTPFSFAQAGSLARALEQAGFAAVHEEQQRFTLAWPGTPESYWEFFLAGAAALRTLMDSLSAEQRQQAVAEVLSALGSYYDQQTVSTPALAVVAHGTR